MWKRSICARMRRCRKRACSWVSHDGATTINTANNIPRQGMLGGEVLVLPLVVGLEEHVTRVKFSCGSPRRAHNTNEQYSRERIDTQQRYHSSEFPEKCQETASLLLKQSSEKRLGWGIEGGICRAVVETACADFPRRGLFGLLIGQWVCSAAS